MTTPTRHTVLRVLRERSGATQNEIAALAGVQQPNVSLWERGLRPVPEGHREKVATRIGLLDPACLSEAWDNHLIAGHGR